MINRYDKIEVIHPKLTDEFKCIADKCPATCCCGWSIIWTGKEVQKLKKSCCSAELSDKIQTAFEPGLSYSPIKLDKDGYCPFFENGLCIIHKELGEDHLSYTCREYPRIKRLIGNMAVYTCRMTCYAATEKLLYDKNCMQLEVSYENSLTAMITSEKEVQARIHFFRTLQPVIWSNEPYLQLINVADKFGVRRDKNVTASLSEVFKGIFGWDIIVDKHSKNTYSDTFVYKNVIRALYLEWTVNSINFDIPLADNFCCFCFLAASVRLALQGLTGMQLSKEELIGSFCDFVSVLLSDKECLNKIYLYLKNNNLNNLKFMEIILK